MDAVLPGSRLDLLARAERNSDHSLRDGDWVFDALAERYERERVASSRVRELLRQLATADEWGRGPWLPEERVFAEQTVRRLFRAVVVEVVHGLDFVIELRTTTFFRDECPAAISLLIRVSESEALDREVHGSSMGYHFHYLAMRGGRYARSDVVLTYNPQEIGPPDNLYWEHHSQGPASANPDAWGKRRVRAVYDAARPSLNNPGKKFFKMPSSVSRVLAPQ